MNATPTPESTLTSPYAAQVWSNGNSTTRATELHVYANMADSLHVNYGAPQSVCISLNFKVDGQISAHVTLLNKTATRLAEAMYVSFNPSPAQRHPEEMEWRMQKLNSWVDPLDVADGASKGLHSVTQLKVKRADSFGTMLLETPDAALVDSSVGVAFIIDGGFPYIPNEG